MGGISGGVADTSPTHINQLNSTAHHQTANSHIDVTGSVGEYQIIKSNRFIYKAYTETFYMFSDYKSF